ncbi:MAG TPA: hypothetical protein VFW83_01315 [Bryobacteraceae bacterium]|nr:hypothetical protein [Bryobacteraceae bacterium]
MGTVGANAESVPAWWNYASPQAAALAGIQWEHLRASPFAGAISAELFDSAGLGIPDLDCLKGAREILLSSPPFLAAETGEFPAEAVAEQAARQGFRRAVYKGVALWIPSKKSALAIAQIGDNLVLIGSRKTLEPAIERSLDPAGVQYSPLLAKAARYAHTADLWVVSDRLPDPLANVFVPIEADAQNFEGAVSAENGLKLDASMEAASENAAARIAEELRREKSSLPAIAQGLAIAADGTTISLHLSVPAEQLTAGLRESAPAPETHPAPPAKPAPPERQVIRILGLDSGPEEIPFPQAPADFRLR